jgi:hypothetical protein
MYAAQPRQHGCRVLYFAFDEVTSILVNRAREMSLPFDDAIASGMLRIRRSIPPRSRPGSSPTRSCRR